MGQSNTLANPRSIQYIGKSAKVVLNKKGEVITVIAKSSKAYRIKR